MKSPSKKRRSKGPFAVVKHGTVSIPIYQQQSGSGMMYVVQASRDSRKSRASIEEATALAKDMAKQIAELGSQAHFVSNEERMAILRATELLKPFGVSLDRAVSDYVGARRVLGEVPLMEAVKGFMGARRPVDLLDTSVSDAVGLFLEAKAKPGLSAVHLADLAQRLHRFTEAFRCAMKDVTASAVADWVGGLAGIEGRTRNNYLSAVSALVDFARKQGMTDVDLRTAERFVESPGEITIFQPSELARLLAVAPDELRPYLVIGAFAGLRTAEICRLTWGQVHWQADSHYPNGWIEVKASQAKNAKKQGRRARRLIPMSASLRAWLEPLAGEPGDLIHRLHRIDRHIQRLAAKSGVAWRVNALRHSYGSYRMALTSDENKVALEMGNSPAMIFAHYRQLVSPSQAEEWFRISPAPVENVVTLERTA
jgi:integrase